MYGSEYNLISSGYDKASEQARGIVGGSSFQDFLYGFYESCKCSLDKDNEINERVNIEYKKSLGIYNDIHVQNLKKWQVVEGKVVE